MHIATTHGIRLALCAALAYGAFGCSGGDDDRSPPIGSPGPIGPIVVGEGGSGAGLPNGGASGSGFSGADNGGAFSNGGLFGSGGQFGSGGSTANGGSTTFGSAGTLSTSGGGF